MVRKLGYPIIVALGLMLSGFIALGIAWDGAASVDFVQGQIPYLLSGGAVGLGLIIIGAGLLLFEAGRRTATRLEDRLDALTQAIGGGAISNNGQAAAPEAIAPSSDAVVIGRSSFHTQDCRLVEGKSDLTYASMADAIGAGLNACRVCDPAGTFAGKK